MEEIFELRSEIHDGVYALVSIISDAESSYMVWEDIEGPDIRSFESRTEFWEGVDEEGLNSDDIDALVVGQIVFGSERHNCYIGLERYEHGSRWYAFCGQGNFPDRQWDVSPIVGWINPAGIIVEDLISRAKKDDEEGLIARLEIRKILQSEVDSYNDAINGNCWGFRVVLYDDGEEVEEDSCWGFLGDSDYCKEEAVDVAKNMLIGYKPKPKDKNRCPHCNRAYC